MYATLTKTRTALAQYGTRCGGYVAGLRASVPASLPASAAALGLPVRSLASVKRAEPSDGTHFLLILGKPGGGKRNQTACSGRTRKHTSCWVD